MTKTNYKTEILLTNKHLGTFSLSFVALLEEERRAYRVQVEESNKQINVLQGMKYFFHLSLLGEIYCFSCFHGVIRTYEGKC